MAAMCPNCFKVYSDVWSVRSCNCKTKLIEVSTELVNAVKLLINLGFKVTRAYYETLDNNDDSKTTKIYIVFETLYPHSLFYQLPPEWEIGDYHRVIDDEVVGSPVSILTCNCVHLPGECDEESVEFDKKLTIANLETWLQ